MQLPGGILVDGKLETAVGLQMPTGDIELMLAEIGHSSLTQPERVSRFLNATVERIGGSECDGPLVDELCVGDRQFLVRQIGAALGHKRIWLEGTCITCDAPFEIPIDQESLPVKQASRDFPTTTLELRGRQFALRTPTGGDQKRIAEHLEIGLDDDRALQMLARMLLEPEVDGDLDESELARIERALEDMAPEVAEKARSACPECGTDNEIDIDPYLTLGMAGDEIFSDINVLARHYHWSEAEILGLPKARRKLYLRLIDRDRGMMVQPGDMAAAS